MKNLVFRARRVWRSEGFVPLMRKSARFVPRYLRHELGKKGLYGRPRYQRLLCWWNSYPHTAVADPFKIVHVDPSEITRVTGRGPNPGRFQWQDLGTVQAGEWDRNEETVEELPVVQALHRRFKHGDEWSDIEFIQQVITHANRGVTRWRGCSSESEVWDACADVDRLYQRIREQGYRSKRELVERDYIPPDMYVSGDGFNRHDEVAVDIGRDGRYLFVDGRHRLAIAKILEIEEIPVRIAARHDRWQQVRERIAETPGSVPNEIRHYLTHPDLSDIHRKTSGEVTDRERW